MKRLHTLCVALLALVLCNTPLFAEDFEIDGIYYNITSETDKTVAVTYRGLYDHTYSNEYSGTVSIPESVTYGGNTYNVTSIGDGAFYECSSLTSITIPNSVTSIEAFAFKECSRLTSVEIPNSVTSIGDGAFVACSSLTSMEIPNSVTSIGYSAFLDCSSLTSVEIPNSMTSIGDEVFSGCSSLTSVEIPNSVTSIGNYAFYRCSSLTSVEIPNRVTSIGRATFFGCSRLTSVVIPNSVTSIGDGAFAGCSSLTSVEIPNSVTSIGDDAFMSCNSLKTATVGCSWKTKSLYNFGANVTVNATLHSYENGVCTVCNEKSLPFEVDGIYYKITSSTNKTVAVTYRGSSYNTYPNEYSGAVTIPKSVTYNGNTYSVTSIGDQAFEICSSLTSVEIPNSVTSIGERAFYECDGLTSVVIPNSVASIGKGAFSGCSSLTSIAVAEDNQTYDSRNNCNAIIETKTNTLIAGCYKTTIPNSVTSIGDYAFAYCSSLTSVVIPNSVTSIGDEAFSGCSRLTSVEIPNSVTSIGDGAFSGCPSLTSVVIPNSVTSIGDGAFGSCSRLTSVEIPNSVTSIGHYAFSKCFSLTSVEIPNSVTSMGDYAFYDCSRLTSVVIGNSVTSIGKSAFYGCSSLTSVVIPNSVTSMGDEAFHGCSRLTSVEIPNSVTSIGHYAFSKCSSLTSVEIPNSVTSIGKSAFYGCSSLKTATVGCSWKTNPLYDFGSGVTVNATLHDYKNGICTVCGDKESPTITYIVDGVVYATIQQKAGETPKLPEPPTKEGYTFKGWKNLPEVMPDEDITVEAEFTINTYEITYVIDDAVFAKQSVTYGEKITPPTAPKKEGYSFSGWKNLPATMPAHDLVIHGTYSKQHYLLTFILDGKVLQQGNVEYGAVITTPSVPAKEGYTFAGWENLPATMPAHDVTVYGTYDKLEYLLTFIADGEVIQQRYVEYGAKIVPPAAPEKEGHAFDGWKNVPETMPARDLEIQGTYHKQSYLLIFVVDDKVIQQDYVAFGTVITTPAAPTKKGHSFAGWENLPTTMPAHDVTVKGLYEVNTHLLRIYLNGALYQTMAVDYGTVLDIPVPTVPEDMEFKGWTTEIPATMPAHDLDIYGTYDYPTSIAALQANQRVTIYTLNGLLICKDAQWQTVKDKLAAGMYIVNGKKIFVKTE